MRSLCECSELRTLDAQCPPAEDEGMIPGAKQMSNKSEQLPVSAGPREPRFSSSAREAGPIATEHQQRRRLFEGNRSRCPKCQSPRMKAFSETDGDGYKCTVCGWTYDQLEGEPELQPPPSRTRRSKDQIYLDNLGGKEKRK